MYDVNDRTTNLTVAHPKVAQLASKGARLRSFLHELPMALDEFDDIEGRDPVVLATLEDLATLAAQVSEVIAVAIAARS